MKKEIGRAFLLGVTGGIATGKSTVAQMLKEFGAFTIDCDLLSRKVVEPNKPAWKEILNYFGEGVLLEDRSLNRRVLSEIVFSDPGKRRKLEEITHPKIQDEILREVREHTLKEPEALIAVIVPLLFEVHWNSLFHKTLLVYAPEKLQIKRLMERDQISREIALKIIHSQMSIEEKKAYADYIIDNSGSLEETRRQVKEIWNKLKKIQKEL
ncbi:MAG: dephospho-CoA kinase [Thermodesulfobacteriota bacterium]